MEREIKVNNEDKGNDIINEKIGNENENINKNVDNSHIKDKEKISLNKKEPKTFLIKINQPTSQKKQNIKITKKKIIINQNLQQKNNINNTNTLNQEKIPKIDEKSKNNNNGQTEAKNKNVNSRINSPLSIKTKTFMNSNQQNNINIITTKKKTLNNKKQNNLQNKNKERFKDKRNKINSGSLINSFISKNKSLEKEKENTNSNK